MTSHGSQVRSRSTRLLALITTFLVALSGLFVVPAANAAAGPEITVTPSANLDPSVENVLTVSGTGYVGEGAANGAYVLFGEKSIWSGGAPLVASGWIKQAWVRAAQITDGAFTTTLTIPANTLDPNKEYHVATSAAHELSATNRTMDAFREVTVAQPTPSPTATTTSWSQVPSAAIAQGENAVLEATVQPAAAGTVAFTEGGTTLGSAAVDTATGKASATISDLSAGAHSILAVFTPGDASAYSGSQTAEPAVVTVNAPAPSGPTATSLVLSASAASVSDGHQVALTATLTPVAANAVTMGTIRFYEDGVALGAAVPAKVASGKVSATAIGKAIRDGEEVEYTAVFTPSDADVYATSTSNTVTVSGTEATGPWNPEIEVFLVLNGTEVPYTGQKIYQGDKIVVRGTGFDPEANVGGRGVPVPLGPQGAYVVFGNFDSTGWEPSSGKGNGTRKVSSTNQGWILSEAVLDTVPPGYQPTVRNQWVKPTADGSFEWTTTLATPAETAANGKYGIYTYAAGGATNADQEIGVLLDYVPQPRPGNPSIQVFLEDGTTPYAGQEVEAGDKLVVKGTGFDPGANVPGGSGGVPIPNSLPQGTFVVFGNFAPNWRPSQGVTDTGKRLMATSNRGWALDPAVLDQVPSTQYQNAIRNGGYVPLGAAGDFTWTVTLAEPTSTLDDGRWGIYTYAGGTSAAPNAAQEISVPINFKVASSNPGGDDEQTAGGLRWAFKESWNTYLTGAAAGTVTVSDGATKGSNGVIVYEQASQNYNESTGRGNILYRGTVSYASTAHGFNIALKDPWITFTADGVTMSAEVSTGDTAGTTSMSRVIVAELDADAPTEASDGTLSWDDVAGVFSDTLQPETWGDRYAGTAIAALSFSLGANSGGGSPKPWLLATPSTGLADGGSITVTGGNLDTETAAKHGAPGTKAGVYVQLGWVKGDKWSPSKGGVSGTDRKGVKSAWVTNTTSGGATAWTDASGSFSVTFDNISKAELTQDMPQGARLAVFTTVAGGADAQAKYEMIQFVEFAESNGGSGNGNGNGGQTGNQGGNSEVQTVGSLRWGVKASFVSYMNGLSDGRITVSGVGGSMGAWLFPQSGSSWNASNGTGSVSYSGSLTFYGHGMTMLSISNPVIQVTSEQNATLSASGVHIANLDLAAAGRSSGSGGAVTWSNAPATLTAAGASLFQNFYGAGQALDPVTFTVGSASSINFGSTTIRSAASIARTPAAAPPATTGIDLVTPDDELVAGGEIEITAGGFEPNEEGILVVIYSEPTVLDTNAKADANGVVRWIGSLPEDLHGEHTITLQGSINVGKVVNIMTQDEFEAAQAKKQQKTVAAEKVATADARAAGPAAGEGSSAWVLWAGAIALLVVAGGMTALVVAQRRRSGV